MIVSFAFIFIITSHVFLGSTGQATSFLGGRTVLLCGKNRILLSFMIEDYSLVVFNKIKRDALGEVIAREQENFELKRRWNRVGLTEIQIFKLSLFSPWKNTKKLKYCIDPKKEGRVWEIEEDIVGGCDALQSRNIKYLSCNEGVKTGSFSCNWCNRGEIVPRPLWSVGQAFRWFRILHL